MVDALATDEGIHQADKELVQGTRSDPTRITGNGLSAVGPVVVRLFVTKGLSSRLSNPTDPPFPSC
jgi:hypothetical protein